MGKLKWVRKSTHNIAETLTDAGFPISANTVGRLLKAMDFSLKANRKTLPSGLKHPPKPAVRNQQFEHIFELREVFAARGEPIISVDSKKKELIGNFKNPGRLWADEFTDVYDHDFRCDAKVIASPYGIYDTQRNHGCVFIGVSCDVPAFASDCLALWWRLYGRGWYPHARRLLVLADSGGSNSARSRVWKWRIQHRVCDSYGLSVTVAHYPAGCSKWNPCEHRLFSPISLNWQGRPLSSLEVMANYLRGTRTRTGLAVNARIVRKQYRKGDKVSDAEMASLSLLTHDPLPDWNYTLRPRSR